MAYRSPKSNRCLLDRDVPRKRICCFLVSRGRMPLQVCGFWSTCPPPNSPKKRGEEIQCCGLLGKYLYSQILVMIEGRPLSPRNVDPAPPRGSISLNFSRWARSLSMIWRHENVGPFLLNL